jgi:hypothetical protein
MGGMEEAVDTIGVPALIDGRALAQFCQAIQLYADRNGLHDQTQEKIQNLLARLNKLRNLRSCAGSQCSGFRMPANAFATNLNVWPSTFLPLRSVHRTTMKIWTKVTPRISRPRNFRRRWTLWRGRRSCRRTILPSAIDS